MRATDRNPEHFLEVARREDRQEGQLRIFLGFAAGVGKTFAMLCQAHERRREGLDVVVGFVESHGREETDALSVGLELAPRLTVEYGGIRLEEMDVDWVLQRRPQIVLVDELAHSNPPGLRHPKRYQDVLEFLNAGIDVYSTLNIQHLESLNDVVETITGVRVRETVPDAVVQNAQELSLLDLPPKELLQRLKDGKVYKPAQAQRALENFFRPGNLTALRELALRFTASSVEEDLLDYMEKRGISGPWPAAERLMVCVSPSPLSEKLVRSAKRLSQALDAEWFAVSVEPVGGVLSAGAQESLFRNIRLAESLGAKLVSLHSNQVAESIVTLARSQNVTKLVVGKPIRPLWQEWLRPSPVDQLIRLSGAIDVYVISSEPGPTPGAIPGATLPGPDHHWPQILLALGCAIAATMIAAPLSLWMPTGDVVMVYLVAVVFAAYYTQRTIAVWTSIWSVLAFDLCFVEPRWNLSVADHGYLLTFFGLLVTGLVVSSTTSSAREQAAAARQRELETTVLFEISRKLASAQTAGEMADFLHGTVENRLGRCDLVVTDQGGLPLDSLDSEELAVADWCLRNRRVAGAGSDTLSGTSRQWRPVQDGDGDVLAVFGFSQIPQNPSDRSFVETLVALISLNLQRLVRAAEAQRNQSVQAAEKLQRALLNSVSHDLRIPMVSINGALSTVRDLQDCLPSEAQLLVDNALTQAERLNRLVENLLQISRIEAGTLQLTKLPCDLQDLLGSTIDVCQPWLDPARVEIQVHEQLPLVMMDFVLMQQVLINLLDNAVKFSPVGSVIEMGATIDHSIGSRDGMEPRPSSPEDANGQATSPVLVWVSDRGPGVPKDRIQNVFERFFRANSTGTGLGLAICEGIVAAHRGTITVNPDHEPGTRIEMRLPIR